MKKTIINCDLCGKEKIDPVEICFHIGYDIDPSGGPASRDNKYLELCPECATKAIKMINATNSLTRNDFLYKEIMSLKKAKQ